MAHLKYQNFLKESGIRYTFDVEAAPTSDGTITVSVLADMATDEEDR